MSVSVGNSGKPRILAFIIDNLFATILAFFAIAAIQPRNTVLGGFIVGGLYLSYYFVFEATWCRTPGKYFQGLYVRKSDGGRCTISAAAIRSLLRILEVNPILLGGIPAGIAILVTKTNQRLGDILAGTIVVQKDH